MTRTCRAPGCPSTTSSRFSPYCTTHRGRLRRQGSIDQRPVSKRELASYIRLVEKRITKNADNLAWSRLDEAWGRLLGHARGILTGESSGRPGPRHERVAARELMRLGELVNAREVVNCALAMFVMLELDGRRFPTDPGFRAQLVRRVLRLTELNSSLYFDRVTNHAKRVYRDLPPRAVNVLGQWLAEAFGVAGMHLGRLELRDIEAGKKGKQLLYAALTELA
jgi:hypothetical protein